MPYIRNKRTGETIFVPDQPQGIPIGLQDPTMDLKRSQVQTGINAQQSNMANDAARLDLERQRLLLAQDAERRAAEAAERAAMATNAPIYDRMTAIGNLENVAGDLQRQFNENFKGAPRGFGGLTEFIPPKMNETNQAFDKRALQAGPFIQSILGLGGKDADAAAEYERKVMPFIPQASNFDQTNAQTLGSLWDFIDAQKASSAKKLGRPAPPPTYRHDRPPERYGLDVGEATLQREMDRLNLTPAQRAEAVRRFNADKRVGRLKAPRKTSGNGWKIERID